VRLVRGSYFNFKVTTPEDLVLAEAVAAERGARVTQRVGIGYDVHRLVENRPLILGGVAIPHTKGLEGHSDADVLLHAISDALLGAAGLGDIGRHFPDTDPQYKGISSLVLLRSVREKLAEAGFQVYNVDAVVEAETPKLAPYISEMNGCIAEALFVEPGRINVKATTTEKLGFVGRKEGIAAQAVVMLESLHG
jgi:2-C-methyl-D-erythritol 4-phosphate cytidylyltransferase/2-C-methyl-D-erythritol 2,4-cyclodiphosphate synthase